MQILHLVNPSSWVKAAFPQACGKRYSRHQEILSTPDSRRLHGSLGVNVYESAVVNAEAGLIICTRMKKSRLLFLACTYAPLLVDIGPALSFKVQIPEPHCAIESFDCCLIVIPTIVQTLSDSGLLITRLAVLGQGKLHCSRQAGAELSSGVIGLTTRQMRVVRGLHNLR